MPIQGGQRDPDLVTSVSAQIGCAPVCDQPQGRQPVYCRCQWQDKTHHAQAHERSVILRQAPLHGPLQPAGYNRNLSARLARQSPCRGRITATSPDSGHLTAFGFRQQLRRLRSVVLRCNSYNSSSPAITLSLQAFAICMAMQHR